MVPPISDTMSLRGPRSKRLRCNAGSTGNSNGNSSSSSNSSSGSRSSHSQGALKTAEYNDESQQLVKQQQQQQQQHALALTKLEQLTCSCNIDGRQKEQQQQQDDNNGDDKYNKTTCTYYGKNTNKKTTAIMARRRRGAASKTTKTTGITQRPQRAAARNEPDAPTNTNTTEQPLKHRKIVIQTLGVNDRNVCKKHMPWFGIDVGGSLVKVVFFDPKETTSEELATLQRIRQYLWSSKAYGSTGRRDAHLEMPNCLINGRAGSLHFIRFATSEMPAFLAMAKRKRFADDVNRTICATGGGACKFEQDIRDNLGISLHKTDEFDSIIYGIPYIDQYNSKRECYFLKDPLDDIKCTKVPYDFSKPYPYLVVNIGSGVSILAVYSRERYSRISGSSIGGGTFLGLCCLLTQCETFDEAISLAVAGSSIKVDKLVKDIYGGDYPKFELSGDTVASAFGHMNLAERRKQVKREDLARALLEMVTNNIGSLARMCAVNHGIDRVVFIGNFLRANQLSMKLLSFAVDYWSKGAIKALFLEHEGYFGAVGCFVESTQGCHAIDND